MASQAVAVGTVQWNVKHGEWRSWSGKNWLPAMYAREPAALRQQDAFTRPKSDAERRETILRKAVSEEVLRGATPILQERYSVVLSYQRPVRHAMHAFATLITLGVWSTVWLIMAITRKEDRVRLQVDDWCNVWGADLPR